MLGSMHLALTIKRDGGGGHDDGSDGSAREGVSDPMRGEGRGNCEDEWGERERERERETERERAKERCHEGKRDGES